MGVKISVTFDNTDYKKQEAKRRREQAKHNRDLRKIAEQWVSQDRYYLYGSSFGRISRYKIEGGELQLWFENIDVFYSKWEYREFWHNRAVRVYDHWTVLFLRDLDKLREVENPQDCVRQINDLLSKTADEYVSLVNSFTLKS